MNYIKHASCKSEVVVKYVNIDHDHHIRIWCPKCARVVRETELTRRGPYSVVLPKDTKTLDEN